MLLICTLAHCTANSIKCTVLCIDMPITKQIKTNLKTLQANERPQITEMPSHLEFLNPHPLKFADTDN